MMNSNRSPKWNFNESTNISTSTSPHNALVQSTDSNCIHCVLNHIVCPLDDDFEQIP